MKYEKKILSEHFSRECNADVARLGKLFTNSNAPFELAYFQLLPHEATIEHEHYENEIFICIKGKATIQINQNELLEMYSNEILFVNKNKYHKIINNTDDLVIMIAVWWYDNIISKKIIDSFLELNKSKSRKNKVHG